MSQQEPSEKSDRCYGWIGGPEYHDHADGKRYEGCTCRMQPHSVGYDLDDVTIPPQENPSPLHIKKQPRRSADESLAMALLDVVRNRDREVTRRILDATEQWTRGSSVDMHAVKNYALDAILTLAKERAMLAESAPEVKE